MKRNSDAQLKKKKKRKDPGVMRKPDNNNEQRRKSGSGKFFVGGIQLSGDAIPISTSDYDTISEASNPRKPSERSDASEEPERLQKSTTLARKAVNFFLGVPNAKKDQEPENVPEEETTVVRQMTIMPSFTVPPTKQTELDKGTPEEEEQVEEEKALPVRGRSIASFIVSRRKDKFWKRRITENQFNVSNYLLAAELQKEMNRRQAVKEERAVQKFGEPRCYHQIRPSRSFGDFGKEFFSLAEMAGEDPLVSQLLHPKDSLEDTMVRGDDKRNYGGIMLFLLALIAFAALLMMVGWTCGVLLAHPSVGISITADGITVQQPFTVSALTAAHLPYRQLTEDVKKQEELKPHNLGSRNLIMGDYYVAKDKPLIINRRLLHNVIHDDHRRLQTQQITDVNIKFVIKFLLQVSNSATFSTTAERLTVGIGWLKPRKGNIIGIPRTQCQRQPDLSVVTGGPYWNESATCILRQTSEKALNAFPIGQYFEVVSLFEEVNFDEYEDDIKVPKGLGLLPTILLNVSSTKGYAANSPEAGYAQEFINICTATQQIAVVIYIIDFYSLRWVLRTEESSSVSRPFIMSCLIKK